MPIAFSDVEHWTQHRAGVFAKSRSSTRERYPSLTPCANRCSNSTTASTAASPKPKLPLRDFGRYFPERYVRDLYFPEDVTNDYLYCKDAEGLTLSIPMPGHPIPPGSEEQTQKDVKVLEDLFDAHDAVFLLMDSRESRWLPTVLGTAKGKVSRVLRYRSSTASPLALQIVLNAALGFDSYLVMRHGARESPTEGSRRLGCYYCNDIVAPADVCPLFLFTTDSP